MKKNYDDIIKTLKDKKQVIENKEDLDYLNAELELFENLRAAEERADKEEKSLSRSFICSKACAMISHRSLLFVSVILLLSLKVW